MARYRIRRGTPGDLDALVRHRRRMWEAIGGPTAASLDVHSRSYRNWIRPRLRSGSVLAFLALARDGSTAGSGCLWFQEAQPRPGEEDPTIPYILSMFTEPAHRGNGVATRLVRAMVRESKRRGHARVLLHASDHGRPVYQALGFERTHEMRLFLRPPPWFSRPKSPSGTAGAPRPRRARLRR